jgi:prepilin-type N-terminal cleavage/methylation domain-containing protein
MFKSKLPQQEQGFTLVEVLIAILITTIFISIAMQAMVIAAVFKVRARQVAEATTWIQEDLENVRFQAGKLRYTQLTINPIIGATSLSLSSVTGFAVGDTLRVGTDSTNYTISAIDQNTKTITISSGLSLAASIGATVVATNPCKASSSTAGFGESLKLKGATSI